MIGLCLALGYIFAGSAIIGAYFFALGFLVDRVWLYISTRKWRRPR